jgi:DNA-binding NtrC family response regulator
MLEGALLGARGETRDALRVLTEAMALAASQHDWEVETQALALRAHAHGATGAELHARRDRERSLELLEERAMLLPPDLRGAFWNVAWRVQLRAEPAPAALASQPFGAATALEAVRAGRRTGLSVALGPGVNGQAPTRMAQDERLVLLLDLSRRLGEAQSLDRVLEQAVRSAVELTGAELGAVLLPGEDRQLVVRTRTGVHRGDGPDESFSRSIAETVWIDGEPVVTLNARGDRRFAEFRSVHDLGIGAIAAVPLKAAGRIVGVLYVENRRRRGAWTPSDLALLCAFGEQAGVAVENARLVEELSARTRDLERAHQEIAALLETRTHELETTRTHLARAQEALSRRFHPAGLVAHTEAMRRVFAVIERVRETDVPVVVEGESGTGKELVARALHFSGARAKGPFVVVHCGAIPETLLESELFGHVRGAFTGADRDRRGLLASAHGGTLLLDEVSEMPPRMQVELLRVLQDRRVRPVGGDKDELVDLRVVCASNRPLRELVSEGRFREDLYYRLAVVTVRIPPLRERVEDIPHLAAHFLGQLSEELRAPRKRLSREALARLLRAPWPGNVRQLRHVLESAVVLSEEEELSVEALHLPEPAVGSVEAPPTAAPEGATGSPLAQHKSSERQRIIAALEQVNWNKVRAAEVLGMPRRTLYRRLREYGLLEE